MEQKLYFLEDRIGSIELGKEADLIYINTEANEKDPYLSVISANQNNLELSMVKGKIIYSKNILFS